MQNKTISLTDDLVELLDKEENASQLLRDLLYSYYEKTKLTKPLEQIEKIKREMLELEEKENRQKQERLSKEQEILKLVSEQEKLSQQEQEEKEQEERKKVLKADNEKRAKEIIKGYIKEFFVVYDDEVDGIVDMYLEEKENYPNFYLWGVAKRLPIKEEAKI